MMRSCGVSKTRCRRDGQLHDAKPGRQVPAGARDAIDQKRPQLVRQLAEFVGAQAAQVGWAVDAAEQGVGLAAEASWLLFGHPWCIPLFGRSNINVSATSRALRSVRATSAEPCPRSNKGAAVNARLGQ
jgi:hypothetical protein